MDIAKTFKIGVPESHISAEESYLTAKCSGTLIILAKKTWMVGKESGSPSQALSSAGLRKIPEKSGIRAKQIPMIAITNQSRLILLIRALIRLLCQSVTGTINQANPGV